MCENARVSRLVLLGVPSGVRTYRSQTRVSHSSRLNQTPAFSILSRIPQEKAHKDPLNEHISTRELFHILRWNLSIFNVPFFLQHPSNIPLFLYLPQSTATSCSSSFLHLFLVQKNKKKKKEEGNPILRGKNFLLVTANKCCHFPSFGKATCVCVQVYTVLLERPFFGGALSENLSQYQLAVTMLVLAGRIDCMCGPLCFVRCEVCRFFQKNRILSFSGPSAHAISLRREDLEK